SRKPATDWGNKPERKFNPISGKYGGKTGEKSQYGDKGTSKKFSYDKRQRPDSGSKPPYKKFGSDNTYEERPSYKPNSDRRERTEEDRKASGKRFGSEWKDNPKPLKPSPEGKERSE